MLFDAVRRRQAPSAAQRPTWRVIRQAGQRLSWGVADQGMSSLSNFAVNIYIARTLGALQYGAFALAFVTYGFALNASRGLATDPLLVRFSGTDIPTWRRAVTKCTGTATSTGLTTGAIILGMAALLSGPARLAFLALGLTMPGLMLQDSWRFAFFALGRGSQAFLNDTVWKWRLFPLWCRCGRPATRTCSGSCSRGRRGTSPPQSAPSRPACPGCGSVGLAVASSRPRAALPGGGTTGSGGPAPQLRRGRYRGTGRGRLRAGRRHADGPVHGDLLWYGAGHAS